MADVYEELDLCCEQIMGHNNWSYLNDPDTIDYKKGDICVIFHAQELKEDDET